MSELGQAATESHGGRSTALWAGALVLAATATGVLVLSGDVRLLRLGLIAALWSALLGAFAVARLRDRVTATERTAEDRQRIYELELEREITARREFEARAEAQARRQAREESAAEIRSLQDELAKLRATLEQVVGGDVLFERVALRAESTRVRSLSERGGDQVVQRPPNSQPPSPGRQITAKPKPPPVPPAAKPAPRPAKTGASQPTDPAARAVSKAEQTEVISQLSGQLDDARLRPRPRPKQHVGQAFPDRPTPARPERQARRPEPPKPEPVEEDSGAHAAGTSVNDLLAAYGTSNPTQGRRRRRS